MARVVAAVHLIKDIKKDLAKIWAAELRTRLQMRDNDDEIPCAQLITEMQLPLPDKKEFNDAFGKYVCAVEKSRRFLNFSDDLAKTLLWMLT